MKPSRLKIALDQRDWLLKVLWDSANLLNKYELHVKLEALGHEDCVACGKTGRLLDGELCIFGDRRVKRIKGI